MRKWLEAFHDQDAVVAVVSHSRCTGMNDQSGITSMAAFDGVRSSTYEYIDLRGNQFVMKGDQHNDLRMLILGKFDA
jgi:hypothetical protein